MNKNMKKIFNCLIIFAFFLFLSAPLGLEFNSENQTSILDGEINFELLGTEAVEPPINNQTTGGSPPDNGNDNGGSGGDEPEPEPPENGNDNDEEPPEVECTTSTTCQPDDCPSLECGSKDVPGTRYETVTCNGSSTTNEVGSCTATCTYDDCDEGYECVDNYCRPIPEVLNTSVYDSTGCWDTYPDIMLQWDYYDKEGNPQEEFQIRIYDTDNNEDYEESHAGSADRFYPDYLNFDAYHEWEVRVKNEWLWSDWKDGESFQTQIRYPEPDFSYEPTEPITEELITFWDESNLYVGDADQTYRKWNFGHDVIPEEVKEGYGSEYETVQAEYQTSEEREVVLELTDSEGRTCSTDDENSWVDPGHLDIREDLAEWREVGPFNFLRDFLRLSILNEI